MSLRASISRRQLPFLAAAAAAFLAGAIPAGAQTRKVSIESLIYDLKNPDAVRRREAVHELGIAKHTAAISNLVAMTQDPDASVRREVELSLEQMEDITTLPAFIRFATDTEKDIRARAVDDLVSLHLPRTTGPGAAVAKLASMVNLWPDELDDIIVEPGVPVDAAVIEALRARLSDPEKGIRRSAARGLGILRAAAAIPELVLAIREDRDDEVRFDAVRALKKIGDESAGGQILPFLNFNNDRIRNELLVTLGSLRYRPAVADMTRVFDQSRPSDRTRTVALAALADIADPSSTALFEGLKNDRDDGIRLYANEGLARQASPAQKTAISSSRLTEKNARVQTAQAFALVRTGQTEYLDELVRALGSPATRDLAEEYLIETPAAMRTALFAQRSEKAVIRAELAEVFGWIGDRAALAPLQDLARDSDAAVVRTAERAIRRIRVAEPETR